MNAARKALIADMRFNGMTGKEAYEASKDPEFMKEWIRVSIRNQRVDGKPKLSQRKWDWRGRLRLTKTMHEIQIAKAKRAQSASKRRANQLRRMFEGGLSLTQALRIDRKRND